MKYLILILSFAFLAACSEAEKAQVKAEPESAPGLTGDGGYNKKNLDDITKRLNATIKPSDEAFKP